MFCYVHVAVVNMTDDVDNKQLWPNPVSLPATGADLAAAADGDGGAALHVLRCMEQSCCVLCLLSSLLALCHDVLCWARQAEASVHTALRVIQPVHDQHRLERSVMLLPGS